MLTFHRSHQQQLDQLWTATTGLPLLLLMEQAAAAVSRLCLDQIPSDRRALTSVLVLAGKGQNGGDAYACARQLAAEGVAVTCLSVFPIQGLPLEANLNLKAWLNLDYVIETDFQMIATRGRPDFVIDGIFGTGFQATRTLPADIMTMTAQVKAWRTAGTQVIAIDIPSGVDADTGRMAEGSIEADWTVTMVRPKTGICATPGRFAAGVQIIDHLGISDHFIEKTFRDQHLVEWIDVAMIRHLKPARHPNSHKGSFGRVLILGGSPGLPGAVSLAAQAASRSGAGLVYLGTGESVAPQALAAVSEALLTALPEQDPSRLIPLLDQLIEGKQVVAIGPGAGQATWLEHALVQTIQHSPALIIDADGLNAVSRQPEVYQELLKSRQAKGLQRAILTPHPGEFARLAPDLDWHDRQTAAAELARRFDVVILLKGASTVIAEPDGRLWINPTGNSGLAKGGSGDVLSGLIAGLIAQGLDAFAAAAAGAYLHGLAADLAADQTTGGTGVRALLPSDVLKVIGRSFREVGWDD
ncbi:MAG: NAD(P)H-hydrate dehydratase [Eubacteriales bacterium]|nr:NAD(P)H-hydrate dehydratase [Eubacteriales bacterium]